MSNYQPKIEWAKKWLSEVRRPYINGQFVHGNGAIMESINPATNEVIGRFETCNEEEQSVSSGLCLPSPLQRG